MSVSLQSIEAVAEATAKQPSQQVVAADEGLCAKGCSIDGGRLRSPLDDADIFNTLFNKWGCDDATEAAAVGSLGEYLFTDGAAAGTGMQRTAAPRIAKQQQLRQAGTAACHPSAVTGEPRLHQQPQQQQQQQPGPMHFGSSGGPGMDAAGAAAAQACMRPDSLMVSAQSMQAMQNVLQMQQQFFTQPGAGMSANSDQHKQQAQAQVQQSQQGQRMLAPSAVTALGQHTMPLGAVPESMGPPPRAPGWPQFMMQQFLQQQQLGQLPAFPGLGCGGPFPPPPVGAFGMGSMFGPAAAAAAAAASAAGFPGLANPCHAPFPVAAELCPQLPAWQQQQQQQQQQSLASCEHQPAACAARSSEQVQPATAGPARMGSILSAQAVDAAAAAAGAVRAEVPVNQTSLAPPIAGALPAASTLMAPDGLAPAAAQAATGNLLSPLQAPLPQELMAALSSMSALHAPPGAQLPGAAAAAAAAAAGMLPGSWPLHLMGLLRPPSLPAAPNVMQLAMMMQAAAQASMLPGGAGLQQTAMLVAALQSMAASNMQGLFGPWGPGVAPWQQPQQQQAPQQLGHNTQNNGSCLGQYGQGHLMSQGTQAIGGQANPKAGYQPGSHPQGGSHLGGSHYVGSHHQTSTTGDYSGQAGDAGCTHSHPKAGTAQHRQAAAAAGGAYGSKNQWLMYPDQQQQQQARQQQQQQWHAAHEAAAAELAAVEAITPRHSKPQHKASGHHKQRGRVGESRRNRANARLRVKGRFVKKGTPGAARAGAEPEIAEQQHTISDHEGSEGETAEDAEQRQGLSRLFSFSPEAAADAADPMLLDDWAGEMQAADAACAEPAPTSAPTPTSAAPAAGGPDSMTEDKSGSDPVMLVSPGNAAHCWAEVVGAEGYEGAEATWQQPVQQQLLAAVAQQPSGPSAVTVMGTSNQQQARAQPQLAVGVLDYAGGGMGLAAAAATAAAEAMAHDAAVSRVERIYSSKRSWVTQQLATPMAGIPIATPCDSATTGPPMQRSASGLPGAAGPCASDAGSGGFPGLFSAPTGCLAAASIGAEGAATVAREMHTCLHLCDSNRIAAGSKPLAKGLAVQQQSAIAGSKRKSTGRFEQEQREPFSSAADAPGSRCGSLISSQVLLPLPDAAVLAHQELPATVPASGTQLVGLAVSGAQQPLTAGAAAPAALAMAATAAAQDVPVGPSVAVVDVSKPCQQHCALTDTNKRQKLESAAGASDVPMAEAKAQAAFVAGYGGALATGKGGAVEDAAVVDAVRLPMIRLAPAPVDDAAAAAQMPPPPAYPRPLSATAAAAAAAAGAGIFSMVGCAAPQRDAAGGAPTAGTAPAQMPVSAPAASAGVASASMAATAVGAAVPGGAHLSACMPVLNIGMLLQQAQQQVQMQPAMQQQQVWRLASAAQQLPLGAPGGSAGLGVGGVVPGAGGVGLNLPALVGLPGLAAQLPQLLSQQQQQPQPQLGLAGLWPAAPAAFRPWGLPAGVVANAGQPLARAQAIGVLPPAVLAPFAAGLHVPHPLVAAAALNGAGVLFGGLGPDGVGTHRAAGVGGTGGGGRRHQAAEGSEQADSCLP